MKKLSQNKRIIIGCIGITLLILLGIYLATENYFDSYLSYFLGFTNGYMIYRWTSWWNTSDNKKS